MQTKKYKVRVQYDKGFIDMSVYAISNEAAKKIVMKAESCPESAILYAVPVSCLPKSKR